jgi:hypothetical protein
MTERAEALLVSLIIVAAGLAWIVAGTYSTTSILCIAMGVLTNAVGWISFMDELLDPSQDTDGSSP